MNSNPRLYAKKMSARRKNDVDKLKRILPSSLIKIGKGVLKRQPPKGKPSACRRATNKNQSGLVKCKSSNDGHLGGAFTWSKHK